jgi:tRNA/rRNA methyltransferase
MLRYFLLLMTSNIRHVVTRFVLIQTNHNGNVGAAARAMKVMGFDELVLVNPRDAKVLNRDKTMHGASGANDVLKKTRICGSVEEALQGVDHACATGMPHSMHLDRPEQAYRTPRGFFADVLEKEKDSVRIAFLFGNERYGMNPEDIDACETVLGIPTNPEFGSLNLASAVQLIAYDWRQALGGFSIDEPSPSRSEGDSVEEE